MNEGLINQDNRRNLVILTLFYIGIIGWGYFSYLEDIWGYFGLKKVDHTMIPWFLVYIYGMIPVFFIPVKLKRPSIFAIWLLYFLAYIPMVIGACFDAQIESDKKWLICTSYLIGFLLLFTFSKVKLFAPLPSKLPVKYFWLFYNLFTFAMLGYVVFLFRDSLKFVNFFESEAVYSLRFAGREIESESPVAGYFIMWLSNALLPFILAVGLISKNKWKIFLGILGMVVLYMTMANKQYLFLVFFLILLYRLFKSTKINQKIFVFFFGLLLISTILLISAIYINIPVVNQIVFLISGIVLLRTVYTSTLMSVYYNVFFENHPYTYYSHISGINQLVPYPFEQPLGIEVGTSFINLESFNANANFFLTDGLSAIGLPGILIIGILCSFVFYLFDSFASKNNPLLGILLISVSAVALMNASLFTTLISGGLIFFMILVKNNKILR